MRHLWITAPDDNRCSSQKNETDAQATAGLTWQRKWPRRALPHMDNIKTLLGVLRPTGDSSSRKEEGTSPLGKVYDA
jgi:hypothetical protein